MLGVIFVVGAFNSGAIYVFQINNFPILGRIFYISIMEKYI